MVQGFYGMFINLMDEGLFDTSENTSLECYVKIISEKELTLPAAPQMQVVNPRPLFGSSCANSGIHSVMNSIPISRVPSPPEPLQKVNPRPPLGSSRIHSAMNSIPVSRVPSPQPLPNLTESKD